MRSDAPTYPMARRPSKSRKVVANGIRLAVYEWGDPDGPPVLLTHGGADFAATFDLLAPRLADAGFRVVAWDQRGHGNSDWAALYSLEADIRDTLTVLDSITHSPIPLVGHSKGAMLTSALANAMPHRVSHLVNVDGMPGKRPAPDGSGQERGRMTEADIEQWLDARRASTLRKRKPGSLDDLARRRLSLNPRLPLPWLKYLASIGAQEDDEGWRWKLDPSLQRGGFGPWRPEWAMDRIPGLPMPFLAVLGTEVEPMGWNISPDNARALLPPHGRVEIFEDTGHFIHIEQPRRLADLLIEFLGRP